MTSPFLYRDIDTLFLHKHIVRLADGVPGMNRCRNRWQGIKIILSYLFMNMWEETSILHKPFHKNLLHQHIAYWQVIVWYGEIFAEVFLYKVFPFSLWISHKKIVTKLIMLVQFLYCVIPFHNLCFLYFIYQVLGESLVTKVCVCIFHKPTVSTCKIHNT